MFFRTHIIVGVRNALHKASERDGKTAAEKLPTAGGRAVKAWPLALHARFPSGPNGLGYSAAMNRRARQGFQEQNAS